MAGKKSKNRPQASDSPLDYSENIECYEDFANAIVLGAVDDYKTELHALLEKDGNLENEDKIYSIRELKNFFFSKWYSLLTKVDPEVLVSRVRALVITEADEQRKQRLEELRQQEIAEQNEVRSFLAALKADGCRLNKKKLAELVVLTE